MATKKITKEKVEKKDIATLSGGLIEGARVTEKATLLSTKSIFALNVSKNATKSELQKAIKTIYKVTPQKISISNTPTKNIFYRGRPGVKGGGKKAYVYLNKGEKLEL